MANSVILRIYKERVWIISVTVQGMVFKPLSLESTEKPESVCMFGAANLSQ